MTSVQDLAREAYESFERKTREDGTSYVARKDEAPEWVADVIREAHGDMLPDDFRYQTIRDAFGAIADASGDLDDAGHEFADDADVYNADLLAWVGSHGMRAGYVDEAREEFGEPRDFFHGLQMGQYAERREIFDVVLAELRRREDENDDE